jgi:predicted ferric reductase
MEKKYKYIGYWFLQLIPLAFIAFYKPYFQYFPSFVGIRSALHIHTFIASLWILLLIAQPLLILNKKFNAHRTLGNISYVLFPLMVASFIPLMIDVAKSPFPKALFFSVADLTLLIVFYGLAIYHKKIVQLHMRYMILTAIVFLGPTVVRIGSIVLHQPLLISQGIQYLLIAGILITLILRDRPDGQRSKPYLTGSVLYVIHAAAFYSVFIE